MTVSQQTGGLQSRALADMDGLARLAADVRPALLRYFARRIGSSSDVEDLVQEVFVRLIGRVPAGAEADSSRVQGYVFETANSVYVDWYRRRKARRAELHETFQPRLHEKSVASTERVAGSREELQHLAAVLNELPERARVIFVLCRIEGRSHREVANTFGITISGVEKHMRRAIAYIATRCARS